MPKSVTADILVPAEQVEGQKANCYRIIDDPDPENDGYLVDWMWFEKGEGDDADCATVVSRVRIPPGLMKTFQADASKIGAADVSGLKIRFSDVAG